MSIRAGIIGTGFMARVHAQAIASGGHQLVGVTGSSRDRAADFVANRPGTVAFESIRELIDLRPDVVHVTTPNALHREQAEQIIDAGIGVIVEKPLATSVEDAEALASRQGDVPVAAVPFIYRYYGLVREIRERIRHLPGNRLWMLHGSYLQDWLGGADQTNWRVDPAAGGASRAFGDIGVHWCDLMEFVTGHRITTVTALVGNAFEREGGAAQNLTEDGAVLTFTTDQGALGSLVVSQASAGRDNRLYFSFDGPDESYEFDQQLPERAWVGRRDESRLITRNPSKAVATPVGLEPVPAGHPQGYQQCFNDFVADAYAAFAGQVSDTLPTFADGLRAAHLTEAVLESARTGMPVRVAADEALAGAAATAR
ncbi:Gfo/Idh/MocA family oxidoreductase [Agromyces tropicus]|uniref:Gfo/Idh/MocA family oxidoreductase n=1 Tax=Agromyces tropicus TaxID=555371 RepID=A0ABN2TZU0_9MICO